MSTSLETKIDALEKKIEDSHWSIANTQSKNLGDVYTKLAVHTEILQRIDVTLNTLTNESKIRNGRIEKLETFKSETNNSFKWIRWGGSALFIIVSGLGVYAYTNDIKAVKVEAKEMTATAIKEHEAKDSQSFQELVKLIKENGKR